MHRRLAIFAALAITAFAASAKNTSIPVNGRDTLDYRYTPITLTTTPQQASPRGFARYIYEMGIDRSFEQKIDFSIIPTIYYSTSTNIGLAVAAIGLYRIDRHTRNIPPSRLTIYANASIVGHYRVGVASENIFHDNRNRLDCNVVVSSLSTRFWGIGYAAATHNGSLSYISNDYRLEARYTHRFFKRLHLGAAASFDYFDSRKVSAEMEQRLLGQQTSVAATSLSLIGKYDSRDNQSSTNKGILLYLRGTARPKALSNAAATSYGASLTFDLFQPLWHNAVLAIDIYGEYNSAATPWQLYPTLGGINRMRGYYEGRFTDRNVVTAQAEIRQRVWHQVGLVAWGGAANLFSTAESFSWRHTLPTYGLGVRFELNPSLIVRLDYGFGTQISGRLVHGLVFSLGEAF